MNGIDRINEIFYTFVDWQWMITSEPLKNNTTAAVLQGRVLCLIKDICLFTVSSTLISSFWKVFESDLSGWWPYRRYGECRYRMILPVRGLLRVASSAWTTRFWNTCLPKWYHGSRSNYIPSNSFNYILYAPPDILRCSGCSGVLRVRNASCIWLSAMYGNFSVGMPRSNLLLGPFRRWEHLTSPLSRSTTPCQRPASFFRPFFTRTKSVLGCDGARWCESIAKFNGYFLPTTGDSPTRRIPILCHALFLW